MTTSHRDDGTVSHLLMTRREFYRKSPDFRNTPKRGEAPMALACDPLRGTVLVQVLFTCEHGRHEKTRCVDCEAAKC